MNQFDIEEIINHLSKGHQCIVESIINQNHSIVLDYSGFKIETLFLRKGARGSVVRARFSPNYLEITVEWLPGIDILYNNKQRGQLNINSIKIIDYTYPNPKQLSLF